MSGFNWSEAATRLDAATPSPEIDRIIEEALDTTLPLGLPEATPFFIKALEIADSVFVRSRVAGSPKQERISVQGQRHCSGG